METFDQTYAERQSFLAEMTASLRKPSAFVILTVFDALRVL